MNDECELKRKHAFEFQSRYTGYYDRNCGICVLNNFASNDELKSNDDNSNNINQDKKYDIILFGSGYGLDNNFNFVSSLQWLSLTINNQNRLYNYDISIDNEKTNQFQDTFVDQNIFAYRRYNSFGYTTWKNFLILFGGRVHGKPIDSIFYFDFFEMKWHKSFKVL